MKPLIFALAAFVGAVGGTVCAAADASATRKPNILIFFVDDMGWAQPGCMGGKLAPTPNMDALARNGVRFPYGYVSGCVCSPSRVGIMTGRYQQRTGHDNLTTRPGTELDLKETTTAQRLKEAGYTTGIVGKWHLGVIYQLEVWFSSGVSQLAWEHAPEFIPVARPAC